VAADSYPVEDGGFHPAGEERRLSSGLHSGGEGLGAAGFPQMRRGRHSTWLRQVDWRTSDLLDGENVGGGEEQVIVRHVRRRLRLWRGAR
jgi:hypothetical protein